MPKLRVQDGSSKRTIQLSEHIPEAGFSMTWGVAAPPSVCLVTRARTGDTIAGVNKATLSGMTSTEWEMIEITVDSGACDTVLHSSMLQSVITESTEASRAGEEFEVANKQTIVNEGQKRCIMMTPGSSTPKEIIFQVADVRRLFMSVAHMADAGFECLLAKDGGVMRDVDTGETIPLIRRGNLYFLRAWVRSVDAPFVGQS